jgi:hypothetical protein
MTVLIELKVQIPAGDAARVRDVQRWLQALLRAVPPPTPAELVNGAAGPPVLDADADMAVHMLAADVKMITGERKKGAKG